MLQLFEHTDLSKNNVPCFTSVDYDTHPSSKLLQIHKIKRISSQTTFPLGVQQKCKSTL